MSMRQSASYIWTVSELVGQGATGNVFICRSKSSGKAYAAKVFNSNGQMRAREVRMREIEVLGKLNHPNIVQLEREEIEMSTKNTVLVMELCDTSLYNILELPENYYGLSEDEFKHVFLDVANGMKYLKEQKVVHRDVKPGNILKKRSVTGRSVYKLTDFGAARELVQSDQRFVSIYGTEEYLRVIMLYDTYCVGKERKHLLKQMFPLRFNPHQHPDVYEKAVMKNFSNKSFDAAVDMWSMGVTFYHAATGQLPFRPYGGRQNKDTMFEIISKKGPRIISGVQKTKGGRIEYDEDLPEGTRLSSGLKNLVRPALQELLETTAERLEHEISFDTFYRRVCDIMNMQVIDLYCSGSGSWHSIYMKSNDSFENLQCLISEQTGIHPENQSLFYSSVEFSHPLSARIELVTTRENPLVVIGAAPCSGDEIYQRRIHTPPRMPKGKTRPDSDIDILKVYGGISYVYRFCAEDVFWSYKVLLKTLGTLQEIMKKRIIECRRSLLHLQKYSRLIGPLASRAKTDLKHVEKYTASTCDSQEQKENMLQLLESVDVGLSRISERISALLSTADSILHFENWSEDYKVVGKEADSWMASIKNLADDVDKVYTEISKNRQFAQSNLEDLIHMAKKEQVTESLDAIKVNFSKLKCRREQAHVMVNEWISENYGKFSELRRFHAIYAQEEDLLPDEDMLNALDQMQNLSSRLTENSLQNGLENDNRDKAVSLTAINNEVISLENVMQDLLTLVEEGDQKLLKTKEIFDELTFRAQLVGDLLEILRFKFFLLPSL